MTNVGVCKVDGGSSGDSGCSDEGGGSALVKDHYVSSENIMSYVVSCEL